MTHGPVLGCTSASTVRTVTAGLAVVAMVTGCGILGGFDALHMAGEDPGTFGSAIPDVPGDHSYTFGAIPLCVSTGEVATIIDITPIDGQNLQVVAFATDTERDHMFGAGPVGLRGAGFDPENRSVTAPCPDEHVELALELERGSAASGTGEGFVVRYETGSGSGEMVIPFEVRLCEGDLRGQGCAGT